MTAWPAENKLAAPYHVSPAMTGFEELDLYGSWDTVPDCGAVWHPSSVPAKWASCRDGQWVWVEPWGWTWVDAGLWGFAPLHYGRWVRIDDRWGWVSGNKEINLGFWPCRVFDHASNPFSIPSPVYATQSAVPSLDQLNSSPTGC